MPTTPRRRRALADLDVWIGQAERTRDRCQLEIQEQATSAKSTAQLVAALRIADERLALLHRSRTVLLGEDAAAEPVRRRRTPSP